MARASTLERRARWTCDNSGIAVLDWKVTAPISLGHGQDGRCGVRSIGQERHEQYRPPMTSANEKLTLAAGALSAVPRHHGGRCITEARARRE